MKHTPGPWKKQVNELYISNSNDIDIATAFVEKDYGVDRNTALYNAHLISAAPEMLEALEALVATLPHIETPNQRSVFHLTERAKSAIAKARGEK